MSLMESIIRGFFGAGLASMGFAVLFNIRGKYVWYAALTGGVGGLVYNLCVFNGCNDVLANFYAVLALAALSEVLARCLRCTVSTFLACGLIPLVPGGDAYRMMVSFLRSEISKGLSYCLHMVAIAGMIVLGILVVGTATRLVYYLARRFAHKKEEEPFDEMI